MSSRSNINASACCTIFSIFTVDHDKLERYLKALTTLSRQFLRPTRRRLSPILVADQLLKTQDSPNMYFGKSSGPNYDEEAYEMIVEIQTLMRLLETALGLSHCSVHWPDLRQQFGGKMENIGKVQAKVYLEVEVMSSVACVFREAVRVQSSELEERAH